MSCSHSVISVQVVNISPVSFVYDLRAVQPLHDTQSASDLGSESLSPDFPAYQARRGESAHVEDRGDGVQRLELLVQVLHLARGLQQLSGLVK